MIVTLTDIEEAGRRVGVKVAADKFPVLDVDVDIIGDEDEPAILGECVIASVWAPATTYAVGNLVIPATANGFSYRLFDYTGQAIVSGATEPTWPQWQSGYVSENGLYWQLVGPAPVALWDLDLAVHLAFKLKLARALDQFNVKLDQRDEFSRSDITKHLEDMVDRTAPFCVA